jgi:hypothetical protein
VGGLAAGELEASATTGGANGTRPQVSASTKCNHRCRDMSKATRTLARQAPEVKSTDTTVLRL